MNSIVPHVEILLESQRAIWPELGFAAQWGHVLYGGTALALRLGHRASVDFDFFSGAPLDKQRIARETSLLEHGQVVQDVGDTLTIVATRSGGPVKISFFGNLVPKAIAGRVGRPELTDDGVLQIASIDDIFATKAKVLLDRAEAKDYLDIVALLRAGYSLEHALGSAVALYGPAYQPAESLKALTFYGDGNLATIGKEDRKSLSDAVAAFRALPEVDLVSSKLEMGEP